MNTKALLRDLVPPLLLRWRQKRAQAPQQLSAPRVHRVVGGPLHGHALLVDTTRPAFQEMVEGRYDPYIWSALPRHLDEGLILDVGAHIGYHSLCFAALYPTCKVVAFEPNPANQERFGKNLELSPVLGERVRLMGVALGDQAGMVEFRASDQVDDQTSSGGYLGTVAPPLDAAIYERSGFQRSQVEVKVLDDLASKEGWPCVRLIKIDVEGAEHLVISGARGLLERWRPILLIEIHSAVCMLKVLELLHPLGYTAVVLHEDRPGRCFIQALPASPKV